MLTSSISAHRWTLNEFVEFLKSAFGVRVVPPHPFGDNGVITLDRNGRRFPLRGRGSLRVLSREEVVGACDALGIPV